MTDIGITKASPPEEGMMRLNVGGSHLNIHRSVLERRKCESSASWTLGNLFERTWDTRLPRDTDDRMVLDESPVCVKHLVHGIFMQSATTAKKGTKDIGGGFTVKEEPYLDYVARALGLSRQGQV